MIKDSSILRSLGMQTSLGIRIVLRALVGVENTEKAPTAVKVRAAQGHDILIDRTLTLLNPRDDVDHVLAQQSVHAPSSESDYPTQARLTALQINEKPAGPREAVADLREYRELDNHYRRYKLSPENQPGFKKWKDLRRELRDHLKAGRLKGNDYEYNMTLEERDWVNDESMSSKEVQELRVAYLGSTRDKLRKENRSRR